MDLNEYRDRILVVDDNKTTLFLLEKLLAGKYTLLSASSGPEALRILKDEEPPDLILSDIMMPEMSGYELFYEIKKDPRIASIPIIFVTALGSQTDELKGLETGAVDYIVKPIETTVLTARVKNILELSQYRRDITADIPGDLDDLLTEEAASDGDFRKEEEIPSRPPLILTICDRDTGLKEFVCRQLAQECDVVQFSNETDAHEYCEKETKPDLILLDFDLSKERRFNILKQFKQSETTKSIPVILITSFSSIQDETAAFEYGCADYVAKPLDPSILKARICIHIELHKHRQCFEQQMEAFTDDLNEEYLMCDKERGS